MFIQRIKYLFTKSYSDLFKHFLTALGIIWLLIEFFSFFIENSIDKNLNVFFISIGLSSIYSIFKSFPSTSISKKSSSSHVEIEIQINELANFREYDIAVPSSDCFDTEFPKVIGEKTVKASIINKEFNGNSKELDKLLHSYLKTNNIKGVNDNKKLFGKNIRYSFGTTAVINSMNRRIYIPVTSIMTNKGYVQGTKESLCLGLCGLWDTVRQNGQLKSIAIPIIGSGESRTKSSKIGLIQLAILSFVIATNDSKVSNKLIISVLKKDYDPQMFVELKKFLNTIEF